MDDQVTNTLSRAFINVCGDLLAQHRDQLCAAEPSRGSSVSPSPILPLFVSLSSTPSPPPPFPPLLLSPTRSIRCLLLEYLDSSRQNAGNMYSRSRNPRRKNCRIALACLKFCVPLKKVFYVKICAHVYVKKHKNM